VNEIQVFPYQPGQRVRATTDENGVAWFVAADVCQALDIGNPAMALARLDEDEKGISSIDTLGGQQNMGIINESGLYSLILTSRKPEAKQFKRWVTHEVLPAIARHGFYATPAMLDRLQIIGAQTQGAIIELERQRVLLDKRIRKIESLLELKAGASEWMSVNAYRVNIGLEPLGVGDLIKAAMEANYLSEEQGYGVLRHSGGALGSRNQYHINVLNIMYPANSGGSGDQDA
jgi:prophage antirepressor-like protein